jgi:hypothetical protein
MAIKSAACYSIESEEKDQRTKKTPTFSRSKWLWQFPLQGCGMGRNYESIKLSSLASNISVPSSLSLSLPSSL